MGQTTWPLHGNDFYPVASRNYSLVTQSQSQTILPHALWMTSLRDAKIILTVRDNVEVWHKPVTDTLWAGHFALHLACQNLLIKRLCSFIRKPAAIKVPQYILKYIYLNNHPEEGRQAYLDRNDHVRNIAPKDKFLEFNVKQGSGSLCDFLGVRVPRRRFQGSMIQQISMST